MEPLLTPSPSRFTLFPLKYPEIYMFYKKSVASFWTVEEIDLEVDIKNFGSLPDPEQRFLKHTLAFFAAADGIVNENIVSNFCNEVQVAEARAVYSIQAMMETIHSETYSLLIESYIRDEKEKSKLFDAIVGIKTIRDKADWIEKYMDERLPFAERLVAFGVVEGVFFSSAFASIFYYKNSGKLPGLIFANELIARDEGLHTEFCVLLYKILESKPSNDVVYNIVRTGVDLEKLSVDDALRTPILGLNKDSMKQYVEFVADFFLVKLGLNPLYKVKNPLSFMENIGMNNKTNFFESRVGDYQLSKVMDKAKNRVSGVQDTTGVFSIDDDF